MSKLPAPRIQLRWAKSTDPRWQWMCHYELVLPLDKYDVRREMYDEDGEVLEEEREELVAALKEPSCRTSFSDIVPCTGIDGLRFCDTPFRDGAHALWDSKLLGNLPVYCIAPDGMSFEVKFNE